jgi:hypothetical protein
MTTSAEAQEDSAVYVALDEYEELIDRYEQAKQHVQEAVEAADEVRSMLLKLLPAEEEAPDGVIATVGGVERLSYKPYGARQLNVRRLRDLYPAIAHECTDWVVRRRLMLKLRELT